MLAHKKQTFSNNPKYQSHSIMPTKKNKKAKVVKKILSKKAPVKKPIVAQKKVTKKPVTKKTVAKKPLAKASKKPLAKASKKPVKAVVKKKAVAPKAVKKPEKKIAIKKVVKEKSPKKPAKILVKDKEVKGKKSAEKKVEKKPAATKSLAKTILAKHFTKTGKLSREAAAAEAEKAPAPKNEALQRAIIVRKSDGKNKTTFKIGDFAVYPSHGIGQIIDIEKTIILNQEFKCYLMYFEREKLTIKIPMNSAEKIGLRSLISKEQMDEVFAILRSGVKKLKGMWSRRAQEYETKINSGDIILLAEVLRDLTRDIEDSERSYSERIIYETAIHRLANEYSVIYGIALEEAKEKIVTIAKDKLGSETRVAQKDEFDEFDIDSADSEDEDEEEEDEDEEEEDDDFDYDDDEDDDAPKKRKKKK